MSGCPYYAGNNTTSLVVGSKSNQDQTDMDPRYSWCIWNNDDWPGDLHGGEDRSENPICGVCASLRFCPSLGLCQCARYADHCICKIVRTGVAKSLGLPHIPAASMCSSADYCFRTALFPGSWCKSLSVALVIFPLQPTGIQISSSFIQSDSTLKSMNIYNQPHSWCT